MFRNREIMLYTSIAAATSIAALFLCHSLIAFALCVCIYAVCMIFTQHRYRKIAELAAYLQRLSSGGAAMDIRENAEGELSILKNEIYRVTTVLTEQAGLLQKDKLELAKALSDISHQLKTPLTSLGIMTDLLESDNLPADKRREFISSIRASQQRMEWLALALLKMAKLDADAAALKHVEVPLAVLVEKALAPMLIPMEIKNQTHAISGESAVVMCDPDWTVEALGNIIKNAVENTPDGGRIGVAYGATPLYSFITVRDSGRGIDRADLPHLFKRFYRGKNAGHDSVGIGLAMSLAIMQKQNGDIEVENDNGSVFTLKFYK